MTTPAHLRIAGCEARTVTVSVVAGTRHTDDNIPDHLRVLDDYTPSASVTPWDCYGRRHWREVVLVLGAAGIPAEAYEYRREGTRAMGSLGGSGPGGRVRMGDDMMPSTYLVAVLPTDLDRAKAALAQHRAAVDNWLFRNGPRPAILNHI